MRSANSLQTTDILNPNLEFHSSPKTPKVQSNVGMSEFGLLKTMELHDADVFKFWDASKAPVDTGPEELLPLGVC